GAADVTVTGVAPIDRAGPDDLSFLASKRYLPYFQQSRAAVVLCKPDLAQESGGPSCRVLVRDPHVALLSVIPVLYPEPSWTAGVHPTAVIGRGAVWTEPVAIGPYAVRGEGVRPARWTAAASTTRSSARERRSTTSCRSGTTVGSGRAA